MGSFAPSASNDVRKIVIADRSSLAVTRKSSMFSRADIKVFSAHTGNDILTIHRREHVQVIVIGIGVTDPVIEDVCRTIRTDGTMRQVSIVITGGRTVEDRLRSTACRANHYFETPLDEHRFQEKISSMLHIMARKGPRILVRLKVTGSHRLDEFFAYTEDLSSSGMLVETDKVFMIGDHVECALALPGIAPVQVRAEIVNERPGTGGRRRYGASFSQLSAAGALAISDFLKKQAS